MSHKLALLIMTDGRRDELDRTIASAEANLRGPIMEWYLHDDTGNDTYRRALECAHPDFLHIGDGPRRGFGGAITHAWRTVEIASRADFLFHLEADFTFNREVDLEALAEVMIQRPHLAQMALRRQAWSPEERQAGGVVEMWPYAYDEREDYNGTRWLEHRLFYTTNPHLASMDLVRRGWPDVPKSEKAYTDYLLRQGTPGVYGWGVKFGYWGRRTDDPWVHHIGNVRTGHGY